LPDVIHLKLTIAYDGTGLVGWQRQPTGTSVQGLLEAALAPLEGGPVVVSGAGRTDAGVHARAQIASVTLHRAIPTRSVVLSMNQRLPPAVRVLGAEEVGPEFHARFRSVAKTYQYRIWNSSVLSPFESRYVWHVAWPILDREAMNDAAARLVGAHDFAVFQGPDSERHTTVRTIFASKVYAPDEPGREPLIVYDVRGDGFLRHMVRAIVGTLVEVGTGRRPAAWIDDVLESKERSRAGRTAPASGLFLTRVEYETGDL
jgi:tRNA pseudouridine38-40 synthase